MNHDDAAPAGNRYAGYVASALALILTAYFLGSLSAVQEGETIRYNLQWVPSLGVGLNFMIDGLSLIFSVLIAGIGTLIFLYATGYMGNHRHFIRFILYLFTFMLSMLGLVLASDLITLFVFWELTSVTSYLLIGFNHNDPAARRNALQAMLITAAGGLALLAGFILIGNVSDSYDLAVILQDGNIKDSSLYHGILILILLGAFTKSAQFPFHFWLPNAMSAPTPVSAYLHSATMVNAGVYLLARLHPALGGTLVWTVALTTAGAITAVLASILAFRQTDLKQALAYTTLMALGVITLMLAGNSSYALTAAVTFLVVHSLYKAALFMVVGSIDHGTGTRDIRRLSGLAKAMPWTATAGVLAAASMAGLPPFLGWIGKELLYAGSLTMDAAPLVIVSLVASNALIFAIAGIVGLKPFLKQSSQTPTKSHEAGLTMLAGPLVLGLMGLVVGLFSQSLIGSIVEVTVTESLAREKAAELTLWAGFNLPLALSAMTFSLGAILYLKSNKIRPFVDRLAACFPDFDRLWDKFLDGFRSFAAFQTRLIQPGELTIYLRNVFLVLALASLTTLMLKRPSISVDLSAPPFIWLIALFTAAGALLAVTTKSRIAAISGIGTMGVGVALIFIFFGAPDVATTQLMVEVLAAVMFGIAALRLPRIVEKRSFPKRLFHACIACVIGGTFSLTLLAISANPLDRHITAFFEQNAYALAHGLNIVNVILVDFRALDTFGEITVVLLAAVGAYSLLTRRTKKRKT